MKMLTWSLVVPPHGPLSTVHWNTFSPTPRSVILVFAEAASVIVPEPLTKVQVPVPGKEYALPDIVAVFTGKHRL